MYGSQVWGTGFLQVGREFSSSLSTLHLHFLKATLGVNFRSVLPLTGLYSEKVDMNHCSFTGFGQMSNFSIACLISIGILCGGLVQADLNLQPRSSACWTAQLLSAFQGLRGCELYVRAVPTGRAVFMQEFIADLKHRMRGV
jgi:hypothetical protein